MAFCCNAEGVPPYRMAQQHWPSVRYETSPSFLYAIENDKRTAAVGFWSLHVEEAHAEFRLGTVQTGVLLPAEAEVFFHHSEVGINLPSHSSLGKSRVHAS